MGGRDPEPNRGTKANYTELPISSPANNLRDRSEDCELSTEGRERSAEGRRQCEWLSYRTLQGAGAPKGGADRRSGGPSVPGATRVHLRKGRGRMSVMRGREGGREEGGKEGGRRGGRGPRTESRHESELHGAPDQQHRAKDSCKYNHSSPFESKAIIYFAISCWKHSPRVRTGCSHTQTCEACLQCSRAVTARSQLFILLHTSFSEQLMLSPQQNVASCN